MQFSGEPRSSDRETEASLFYRNPRPEANAAFVASRVRIERVLESPKVEDTAKMPQRTRLRHENNVLNLKFSARELSDLRPYFTARTSGLAISGGFASNSPALANSALAISPLR